MKNTKKYTFRKEDLGDWRGLALPLPYRYPTGHFTITKVTKESK